MLRNPKQLIMIIGLCIFNLSVGYSGEEKDMGGWGIDGPYNKYYDAVELDSFKAYVVKITEVIPMPGMSPGVALHVKEAKSPNAEIIVVHLCPTWFIKPESIGLKRGERVKLRGVWAEINGEDVFLASKVKKGNYFSLKVRLTKDGKPFWTMSPEELAKEREAVKPQASK
jgi:hypothetical protein